MDLRRHIVSCRLSDEEKKSAAQKAQNQNMELGEYIRYKILREDKEFTKANVNLFKENQNLIIRLIIAGYLKTSAIADNLLSEEVLKETVAKAISQQKKLGIEKEDES